MEQRYPDCAIIMRGRTLNDVEEQWRQESVARNLRRFREAELYFEQQKLAVKG